MTHARRTVVLSLALGAFLMVAGDAFAEGINIATSGTGILGIAGTDDGTRGTDYSQYPSPAYVNDGDIATRAQTWAGNQAAPMPTWEYDWVGVAFGSPQDAITSVQVVNATFRDGGWWGTASAGPGAGGALAASDLVAPKVQVTSDGGTTWTDVSGVADDYVTALTGHLLSPNPSTSPVATFMFPIQSGIDGIRLFGTGGGVAGSDPSGFIGVFEFGVLQIPEPSTLAMLLGLGGIGLLGYLRRRRRS